MNSKIIILSAPSGSGKTTIASEILNDLTLKCSFSVSATSRPPRSHETDGVHYYFLSPEHFRQYISEDKFVEWEEVYEGQYYGTLRSEIENLTSLGKNIVFDVDVKGGVRLKTIFGEKAISIFIMPPSLEELQARLRNRNTENEESLQKRIDRASEELLFADKFDVVVINDNLGKAIEEVRTHIARFTSHPDEK
jgi:guanylate kinase